MHFVHVMNLCRVKEHIFNFFFLATTCFVVLPFEHGTRGGCLGKSSKNLDIAFNAAIIPSFHYDQSTSSV